jgi:predicted transposase/invertase (TIGR01784 family)
MFSFDTEVIIIIFRKTTMKPEQNKIDNEEYSNMAPNNDNQDLFNIPHPHDRLFHESMQDIDIARKLSSLALSTNVQNHIDWKTLEIVKESWVDEKLKEHRSDVIYRAKTLENDQWVYLLFEHKSSPDKRIHFQLLRYIVEIWDQHENQHGIKGHYPLIIPIVICHCNDRPCNMDNSMKDNIAILEGTDHVIPDFHFFMLDLSLLKPEQIDDSSPSDAGTGKLKMLLLSLKYSRSPEILGVLPQIIRISEEVEAEKYDYLYVVLTYLESVISEEMSDRFRNIVVIGHRGGETYMRTIADRFRDEGREEGRLEKERELKKVIEQKDAVIEQKDAVIEQKDAEIKQEEKLVYKIVRRMTLKGINLQSIHDLTGLSNEVIEKIIKNT